jgi:hypothetical protein
MSFLDSRKDNKAAEVVDFILWPFVVMYRMIIYFVETIKHHKED